MKLSNTTVATLKNFSAISTGMVFEPGNVQAVVAKDSTIFAESVFSEEFPSEFGIFQLSTFINNISLFKEPELEFRDNTIVLGNDDLKITYRSSSPSLIRGRDATPFATIRQSLLISDPEAEFKLSSDNLQRIIKVSTMNQLPHISISGENNVLTLRAFDMNNDTSNEAIIKVQGVTSSIFESIFLVEHMDKLLVQDYSVAVKDFARFQNDSKTNTYYIAMQVKKG